MIVNEVRLQASLRGLNTILEAIENLRATLLPHDPALFAVMSEAYLDQLDSLRKDVLDCMSPKELFDYPPLVTNSTAEIPSSTAP